jgi:hypothetical protein
VRSEGVRERGREGERARKGEKGRKNLELEIYN